MKNVTKILMVVALATFSFQSFAQTFGVKAGLNMSKITEVEEAKMLLGFHVGAIAEMDIAEQFAVETGLILSTKGVKLEGSGSEEDVTFTMTVKMRPIYLEIPVNAKYKIDLGGKNLYFAAGPYLAFGVGGNIKADIDIGGIKSENNSESLKWGNSDEDHIKRMDFGINIGAGVDLGHIGVGVQYGLGLSQIIPDDDMDKTKSNRVLSLSLSYKFAK